MNKRNFGQVIKRIEARPELWDQSMFQPAHAKRPRAYCFMCHAEYVRTDGKGNLSKGDYNNKALLSWLGISEREAVTAWFRERTLYDFKRWHKAGKVE